jgi:hypothetical protein
MLEALDHLGEDVFSFLVGDLFVGRREGDPDAALDLFLLKGDDAGDLCDEVVDLFGDASTFKGELIFFEHRFAFEVANDVEVSFFFELAGSCFLGRFVGLCVAFGKTPRGTMPNDWS